MERRFSYFMLIVAVSVSSCGLVEIGGTGEWKTGAWTVPGAGEGTGSGSGGDKGSSVFYMTGFGYPDGYDWKTDAERGSVKCSLVVFADMVPVIKVPVGDSYETGSDPDMHRIIGGHLYTDWSTSSETIIKKDGRPLFRYPGREMICGMVVDGDDVHTIGQNRDGGGFSYRKNGEVVVGRKSGYVFENLRIDGCGISFAFCEPVGSGSSVQGRYYNVINGTVSQVAVREDVKNVLDIMCRDGEVSYLADIVGIDAPVAVSGENMYALEVPRGTTVPACRFAVADGTVFAEGLIAMEGLPVTGALWRNGRIFRMFDTGYTVSSLCTFGDGVCCILNSAVSGMPGMIFRSGEIFAVPAGYAVLGKCPVGVLNGILHVGLSSLCGKKPAVWKDGTLTELDMNGYISSIYVDDSNLPMTGCARSWDLR